MFKYRICASVFLLISSVMLAALLFSFYPKEAKPEKAKTCGPYVGYTHDSDSEKIDLYTNDGAYVTSVAVKILSGFLNQPDEPKNAFDTVAADFYCGKNGNLTWVYAASKPTFHSSAVNLYTFSETENTEMYYFDIVHGGIVTGAVFASDTVGFVSLRTPTERGFELYATFDAGASWKRVDIQPPYAWSNRYSLIPVTSGLSAEDDVYLFMLDTLSAKQMLYLVSEDGGNTWFWKE